jgi:hypothetical protein
MIAKEVGLFCATSAPEPASFRSAFTTNRSEQTQQGDVMAKSKFRPLHDRVVVKRIDAEEKTRGGIIIPDTAKEKPSQGEVTAVGRAAATRPAS